MDPNIRLNQPQLTIYQNWTNQLTLKLYLCIKLIWLRHIVQLQNQLRVFGIAASWLFMTRNIFLKNLKSLVTNEVTFNNIWLP